MIYLLSSIILIFSILIYFKIAEKYNIVDIPNERSSHTTRIIRGGGIIFPIAVIIWFILSGFTDYFFFLGFLLISIISFSDDIFNLQQYQRLLGQFISVYLLLLQINIIILPDWIWIVCFILITGWINAFNFMDGINGLSVFYTGVSLAIFYWIPELLEYRTLIKFIALPVLIFGFFNIRKQAITFLGDVGSVSIGFLLSYLMLVLLIETHRWEYIIFFSVYGIDSVLTICQRIFLRENIFLPHRRHFYQYLVNEKHWSHLVVSVLYAVLQGIISLILVLFIIPHPLSSILSISFLTVLGLIYLILKYQVIYSLKN